MQNTNFILKLITLPIRYPFGIVRKVFLKLGKRGAAKVGSDVAVNTISGIFVALIFGSFGAGGYVTYQEFVDPWIQQVPEPCDIEKTCIVLAGLQGDMNGSQTDHVRSSLDSLFYDDLNYAPNVQIQTLPIKLERELIGNSTDNRAVATSAATSWLIQQNADILIYGSVVVEDQFLRLRIMSAEDIKKENYGLAGETSGIIELPANFSEDIAAVFVTVLQRDAADLYDRAQSSHQADSDGELPFKYLEEKLKPIVESPPASLSKEFLAKINLIYGLAILRGFDGKLEYANTAKAVDSLRNAIALIEDTTDASKWSEYNHILTYALSRLYKQERNTESKRMISEEIVFASKASLQNNFENSQERSIGTRTTMSEHLTYIAANGMTSRSLDETIKLYDEAIGMANKALIDMSLGKPANVSEWNRLDINDWALANTWLASAIGLKADLVGITGDTRGKEFLESEGLEILRSIRNVEIIYGDTEKLQSLDAWINHINKAVGEK